MCSFDVVAHFLYVWPIEHLSYFTTNFINTLTFQKYLILLGILFNVLYVLNRVRILLFHYIKRHLSYNTLTNWYILVNIIEYFFVFCNSENVFAFDSLRKNCGRNLKQAFMNCQTALQSKVNIQYHYETIM